MGRWQPSPAIEGGQEGGRGGTSGRGTASATGIQRVVGGVGGGELLRTR
jgi:hypothetical protein